MRKIWKLAGIVSSVLLILLLAAYAIIWIQINKRIKKQYAVTVNASGRLFVLKGCAGYALEDDRPVYGRRITSAIPLSEKPVV